MYTTVKATATDPAPLSGFCIFLIRDGESCSGEGSAGRLVTDHLESPSIELITTADAILSKLPAVFLSFRRGWFPSSYCRALTETLVNNR